MKFIPINSENRRQINEFIKEQWLSTEMVVRGEVVDMTVIEGVVAYDQEEILGLATYRIDQGELEIMSFDSVVENQGIGTQLLNQIIAIARNQNCHKLKLITTNDNMNAIRFYQKRGFDMAKLYRNALEVSRRLKPSIPLIGDYGIPLRHEIEFEMLL